MGKINKMKKMLIQAINSPIITEKSNIFEALFRVLKKQLKEKDILVIASKVLAITQNKLKSVSNEKEFNQIVAAEADQIIGGKKVTLTIKNDIFTPWAGVDRSNVPRNTVILWPEKAHLAAEKILGILKKKFKLQKMGVIITDSFCRPLRKGIGSIAISHAGFFGVIDLRGKRDLFGKKLHYTQVAMADNLATAAGIVMGEGRESAPFTIIRNAPVVFTDKKISKKSLVMPPKECLYAPLYKNIIL